MDLVAEIEKAKTRRVDLVGERDAAWKELDACLKGQEGQRAAEKAIRDRIRKLQGELYPIDMALGAAAKAAKGKVLG